MPRRVREGRQRRCSPHCAAGCSLRCPRLQIFSDNDAERQGESDPRSDEGENCHICPAKLAGAALRRSDDLSLRLNHDAISLCCFPESQ